MSLEDLPLAVDATVTAVAADSVAILQLMEMGLVPGARVRVLGKIPLGGPLRLRVGDFQLSIRRREARAFAVQTSGAMP